VVVRQRGWSHNQIPRHELILIIILIYVVHIPYCIYSLFRMRSIPSSVRQTKQATTDNR
jgi:flagellar basal body-associated protein FliL